jgi:hypothetical protein
MKTKINGLSEQGKPTYDAYEMDMGSLLDFRHQRDIICRLATFESSKDKFPMKFTSALFAKFGFSYTGEVDRVKCYVCQLEIDSWTNNMDPGEEHRIRSPQCSYVLSNSGIFLSTGTREHRLCIIEQKKSNPFPFRSDIAVTNVSHSCKEYLRIG